MMFLNFPFPNPPRTLHVTVPIINIVAIATTIRGSSTGTSYRDIWMNRLLSLRRVSRHLAALNMQMVG
jgi:hypothetical protein